VQKGVKAKRGRTKIGNRARIETTTIRGYAKNDANSKTPDKRPHWGIPVQKGCPGTRKTT